MKVSEKQLRETVKKMVQNKLSEALSSSEKDFVPGGKGELSKWATSVDSLLSDTMEQIDKLVEQAEEMLTTNFFEHPTVGERNRFLLNRIGMLKTLKLRLVEMAESSRRNV